jgi:hypothetical protein
MLLTRSLKSIILALTAVLVFGAASAAAANEIEGVWSFGGGSIAIQPQANGTFTGTVLATTEFGACPHPAGEEIWTGMTQQSDGSFHGYHQWFSDSSGTCAKETPLGPTAWRVLHSAAGTPYLEVCFSHPGTTQPSIAPSGAPDDPSEYPSYQVTYGCQHSNLIEALPVVPSGATPAGGSVVLPPAKACVSQSTLKIKLKDPKNDALKEVVVKIGSRKVADVKGVKSLAKALKKGIVLTKLPSGTYKISVTATTVLKQQLTGSQTYKACTLGSGNIGLKKVKHHHG